MSAEKPAPPVIDLTESADQFPPVAIIYIPGLFEPPNSADAFCVIMLNS